MKRTRLLVSAVGLAASSLVLSTCRVDSLFQSRTPVVELTLIMDTTASRGNVAVLDSATFRPVIRIDDRLPSKPLPLRWTSSNTAVATVDPVTGKVTGLTRGSSVISVSIAETALGAVPVEASDTVRVIGASLKLEPKDTTLLSVNDTLCYRTAVLDAARDTIVGAAPDSFRVLFDPDSTVRVLADRPGCVLARKTGPQATIEAWLDTSVVKDSLTVRQRVDSIHIAAESDTLFGVGENAAYPATAFDRRQNPAPLATIAWTSSDASIITVDATGSATAQGEGTAYVRARADDGADSVRITVAPSGPQLLEQLKSDGITVLAVGDTTDESSVILRARLVDPDADAALMLDVELRPVGTAFSNTPTATSAAVARGQTAAVTITGLIEDTDYHWQARARGESGVTTVWTSFGDNAETGRDFRMAIPEDPAAATGLGQFQSDGTTEILVGQQATQTAVVFKGTVSDPDPGDQLRLEVELKRVNTDFDGTGTVVSSEVGTGAEVSVTISGIPDDANYHWRARVVDQTGRAGPWTSFGGNPENSQDFNVPPLAEAPDAPTDPTQYQNDGTTTIAVGGIAFQSTVVLTGRLTDADPGDQLTLEVEVRPVVTAFTNAATHTSTAVASGGVASITVSGLSEDTEYHWQFRAVDQTLRASSWSSFGANGESVADFRVALPEPPNAPTGLGQFRGSNDALITLGTTIDERTVVFKAMVTDPDPGDQIRLEVETKELSAPFDGTGTTLGAAVSTGATATVTIAGQTDDKSYHWRARVVDLSGRTSSWVSFETNLETDADYSIAVPEAPGVPASLGQFKSDASTPIATAGITDQTTVVFKATLSDPDAGAQLKLEIERKLVGTAFDGNGTDTLPVAVASGVTASISKAGHTENASYHWRARTLDETSRASAWVSFDVNAESAPDFRINATPETPTDPDALGQFRSDGTTAITVGARTSETTVVFKATMSDPDPDATIRLEVERKPVGTSFDENGTDTSLAVASGAVATITKTGQNDNVRYHWRARAIDDTNQLGAWVIFGGNAETAADYIIDVAAESPNVPASQGQFQSDSVTAILLAGNANQTTVVFTATVSDPDPEQLLRLQVEVRPVDSAFTDVPSATSTVAVSSGTAFATVTGQADTKSYHWRVRTIDQDNLTSGWVSFGGNSDDPPAGVDYTIPGVPEPPGPPAGLGQFKMDASTAVALNARTDQDTVVFRATVADGDPGDMVRLEVEVKPLGTAFTGTGTVIGATAVSSGTVAQVTVLDLADNTSYHWRARARDQVDSLGAWVNFPEAGNAETDADFHVDQVAEFPAVPTDPGQFKSNGTTAIAVNATTDQNTVVFSATLSDADPADTLTLEVEVRPLGTDFTNSPTATSGVRVLSGQTASVTVSGQTDNISYHWQVRTTDRNNQASAWVSFGGNLESEIDYRIEVPEPPVAPASLDQFRSNGITPITTGATTDQSTVVFQAAISDPDPTDLVGLDLEVRPIGQSFTGTPTHPRVLGAGGTVQVTVSGLADDANYHWSARSRDQSDSVSGWVSFGANADGVTDFSVAVPQAPSPPADSALKQLTSFGDTAIAVGGTTRTDSIVFRARVFDADPGAQVRIQVEWKPVGTAFDSSGTALSGFVSRDDTVVVTVTDLADDAGYHWRIKTWDETGRQSAWVSFGGNSDPNDADFLVAIPEAPSLNVPVQLRSDSTTEILLAAVITDTVVVFRAGVTDPDPGDAVQLWVERRPLGTAFSNTFTHTGGFVASGGTAYVRVGSHNDNTSYHWQVQAVDKAGRRSGWVKFGANGEDEADYTVNHIAQDPSPPVSGLGQFRSNGTTPVSDGETINVTVLTTINLVMKATLFDPDPGDQLHIEVEVRPVSEGFSGTANFNGSQTVSSGLPASVTVTLPAPGLDQSVGYIWQARACDQMGRCGSWVPYPASNPDFVLRGSLL